MPDIMMCDASRCPASKTCRRNPDSGTEPKEWHQSWWIRGENDPVHPECNHYWEKPNADA